LRFGQSAGPIRHPDAAHPRLSTMGIHRSVAWRADRCNPLLTNPRSGRVVSHAATREREQAGTIITRGPPRITIARVRASRAASFARTTRSVATTGERVRKTMRCAKL